MEIQEQVARLNVARAEAQRVATEGSRLEGVLASAKKRRDELEKQCKDKFDCPVSGLGELIEEFESVAEKELKQAERILGLAEGAVEDSETEDFEVPDEELPEIDDIANEEDDDDPDGPLV